MNPLEFIGKTVKKKSGKPFKSKDVKDVVEYVIEHPNRTGHIGAFLRDSQCVVSLEQLEVCIT